MYESMQTKQRTADLLGFQLSTETASAQHYSNSPPKKFYTRLYKCPEGKHSLERLSRLAARFGASASQIASSASGTCT
jgi:hypothetical protein